MRDVLDALWRDPERAGEIMRELRAENDDLYKFEEMLENGRALPAEAVEARMR